MNRNEHIDKVFRQKMRNFHTEPPPHIWKGIKEILEKEKKSRTIPVFWKYAAGILIIIGIGTTLFIKDLSRETANDIFVSGNKGQLSEKSASEQKMKSELKNEKDELKNITRQQLQDERVIVSSRNGNNKTMITDYDPGAISNKENGREQKNSIPSIETDAKTLYSPPRQLDPKTEVTKSLDGLLTKREREYNWDDLDTENFHGLSKKDKEKKRFSVEAMISPLYTYRDLGNISSSLNEIFNESESGKVSFAGGINLGIQAGKKLSIHSGIIFSRLGISVNDIMVMSEIKNSFSENYGFNSDATGAYLINNSIGSIRQNDKNRTKYDFGSLNERSFTIKTNTTLNYLDAGGFYNPASNYVKEAGRIDQYFQYLEVPFLLKYLIVEHLVDIKILGGVSTNFLIGNKVMYIQGNDSEYIGRTSNIETINYSSTIGFGLNYDVSEQFRFLLEPQFKYYLNSINSATLIRNRPYSFSLSTGFLYLF